MTAENPCSAAQAASSLLATVALSPVANGISISGTDAACRSAFRVGAAAAASVAAAAFESERRITCPRLDRAQLWDPLAGNYETADGWVRLHTNLSPRRAAVLDVLGVPAERPAVDRACRRWASGDLEDAVTAAGGLAAAMRTLAEWDAHAQATTTKGRLPVVVEPRRAADPLRPDDRQQFESLARTADVIVHSSRPGALAGLGYSTDAARSDLRRAERGHDPGMSRSRR